MYIKLRKPLSPQHSATASGLSIALLLVGWSIVSYGKLIDPFFLPTPSTIAWTIYSLFSEHNFLQDIFVSVLRVSVAFILSALMAIPIGIAMSAFRVTASILEPPIQFIRYLPVPALVPLTILWIGIGEEAKIALLVIGTFFQLVLLVMDDTNNIPPEYEELAYTLGAGAKDVLFRVVVPAALPNIYDDLRISLGWCWTYLLIGEIVAAETGIGHVIIEAQRFANPEVVIAAVLIIGVIGLVSDQIFKRAGMLIFRYRY